MTATTPSEGQALPPVRLHVFGGMRLFQSGVEVEIGPPRQRAVLALLVAARGGVVPVDELTDTLWPVNPPASAVNQIHRHIGELRRLLEPGLTPREPGSRLYAAGRGYRLQLTGLETDLAQFYREQDVDGASTAAGRLAIAPHPAFSDLPWGIRSRAQFAAIDKDRWTTAVTAMDLVEERHEFENLLPTVEQVVAEEPLDENLQAAFIRFLVRSGRRAQALAHFDKTRKALDDRLGLTPGSELSAAHLLALHDEESGVPDVPHFIPSPIASFVERPQVRQLLDEVTVTDGGAIVILSGMAGVGKTTLANHWAHAVSRSFPDGQLFLNLRGFDLSGESMRAEEMVNRLLEQLGSDQLAESDSARLAHYRELVSDKRLVLILDNARDAEQVRPLLPRGNRSLVIVTSRNALAGLVVREAARSIHLGRWSSEESRELLIGRIGLARVADSPVATNSIINSCAGLPLALAIASARSALQPDWSMDAMARQLTDATRTLDSLSTSDGEDIRTTFDWSYRSLSPEAARLFRLLSVHPGPLMSPRSLAACAGLSLARTRRFLGELVASNMATESESGAFATHDLLKVYATELLDSAQERPAAEKRLVWHYVWSTREAFLQFGRDPTVELNVEAPEPGGVEEFSTMEEATAWYSRERSTLFDMVRAAVRLGLDREAALLALDWRPMNQAVDSAASSLDICEVAYGAAKRHGDVTLLAELARDVGAKLSRLRKLSEASHYILEAVRCFQSLGDFAGEANAYRNLTQNAERAGDEEQSIRYARLAVETARRSGRPDVLALALTNLAHGPACSPESEEYQTINSEALQLAEESGLAYLAISIRANLAENAASRGEYAVAREWARTVEMDADTDPGVAVELAVTLAVSGVGLDDLTEVVASIDRFGRLVERHSSLLKDHPDTVEQWFTKIERAREWVRSKSAAMPTVPPIGDAT